MTEFPCRNCKVLVKWQTDEITQKARLLEINSERWHNCKTENKTVVNPKHIWWFCWDCGKKIDIGNHQCLHFQKLPSDQRSLVRYGSLKP